MDLVESDGTSTSMIGPTAVSVRSLAPDLARGVMLLLIALSNAPLYLYGHGDFGDGLWVHGHPVLDQLVVLAQTIFVRGRAYPMFAFLFGYGIVQLLRRHVSGGVDVIVVRKLAVLLARVLVQSDRALPYFREQIEPFA
ncbi:MAG: hypothetical protein ACRDSH_08780 [Pseudonocardiaceae bacterium]